MESYYRWQRSCGENVMPKYASPEEQKIDNLRPKHNKLVEEAPYHPGYEDAAIDRKSTRLNSSH